MNSHENSEKENDIKEKKLILHLIQENFEIPEEFILVNDSLERIEMYWEILDESHELFTSNSLECGIVQELPDFKKTRIRFDPF